VTTESEPTVQGIRDDLSRLIAEGLVPYNVAENGRRLLELRVVADRVRGDLLDADEDEREYAYTQALTSVLQDAVERPVMSRKHRRVLKYVLPLHPKLLGMTARERRTEAGKALKDGKKAVKGGTVRSYYEPKALAALAEVLVEMESEYREGVPTSRAR
jgi:hypothetical protein